MLYTQTAVRVILMTTCMAEILDGVLSAALHALIEVIMRLLQLDTSYCGPSCDCALAQGAASTSWRGDPASRPCPTNRVPTNPHDSSLCGKCGRILSCDYSLTHLSQTPSHSSSLTPSFHVNHQANLVAKCLSPEIPLRFLVMI